MFSGLAVTLWTGLKLDMAGIASVTKYRGIGRIQADQRVLRPAAANITTQSLGTRSTLVRTTALN